MRRTLRAGFFLLVVSCGVTCGSPWSVKQPPTLWDSCKLMFDREIPVLPPATSTAAAFDWDTTLCTNGAHTIAAIARDAAGNRGVSSVVVKVHNGGG